MFKAILLASALLSTCEVGPFPKPPPDPLPPSPWDARIDAGPPAPEPAPSSPCARACARFAALGCQEAQPTAAGASCAAVCENIESSGVISMDPECVARAESCSIARACGR